MKKRIFTGIILALILVPAVIIPELKTVFELIVILCLICGSVELLNMFDKKGKIPVGMKICSTVLTLIMYCAIVDSYRRLFPGVADSLVCRFLDRTPYQIDLYMVLVTVFVIITFCMLVVKNFDTREAFECFAQILYMSITFGAFTILRSYGVRFIVYTLIVTTSTDIFALVFGLRFGKHKLAPVVSPKKTWEGSIGGTAVAMVIGFLFLYLYHYISPYFHGGKVIEFFDGVAEESYVYDGTRIVIVMFLATFFMSVCSQIGDLVASKLKRTYGIKDYSDIFPGHGGILDRFDSTLFSSAVLVAIVQLMAISFPYLG